MDITTDISINSKWLTDSCVYIFLETPVEFIRPLADIKVTENQEIFLEVEVNKPNKTSQWFHDGQQVSASKRIKLLTDGAVHKLVIDSAELDDEGKYKVKVNEVECEATVLVDGK